MPIEKPKPVLHFGKYKGMLLDDVPAAYLLWIYENDIQIENKTLNNYIIKNLKSIKKTIMDEKSSQCDEDLLEASEHIDRIF